MSEKTMPRQGATRRLALLGLAALAASTQAQNDHSPASPPPNADSSAGAPVNQPRQQAEQPPEIITHPRVEQFLLGSSRHDGEPWRIHLAWPAAIAPAAGHRVLYLLDGNASFPLAWHALQELQLRLPAARQLVLVGVGYPANVRFDVQRRFYDLTPATAAEYMGRRSETRTGGRDVFLDFIANDLHPAIAQRIAINSQQQTLFGHSLGGLLTLHALYARPHLFQGWIAADPSTWWNGGSILEEEAAFLAGVRAAGGRLVPPMQLLIAQSGGEQHSKTSQPVQQIVSAQASARRLAGIENLDVRYRRFADETHPSMLAPAIQDALAFVLDAAPAHLQRLSGHVPQAFPVP